MDVSGKTAVVTGGGSGLGRALVLALAERGCRVAVADIETEQAERVALEARQAGAADVLAVTCDVSRRESVEALADAAWQRFGKVELVFNNAGVAASSSSLLEATTEELQWVFSVNVTGVWNGCSVFIKRLLATGAGGHIINTASEHAIGVPHVGQGFYTASKHAVLGMSDVLRSELPSNIGVSVLCPGLLKSNLWDAQRNRPKEFGATLVPDEMKAVGKAVIERGMEASEVAQRALEGVERRDFLIVTHAHLKLIAQKRWTEIASVCDRHAPYYPGCEKFDVNNVLQDVLGGNQH
ncbi:SDR family NAD(P)-dependent oxidoreductase [Pseudomonas sp. BGM005]|nr:SDR family NAD(P)-dependent oxidoreductase [Pseudomonas sp. BG5]